MSIEYENNQVTEIDLEKIDLDASKAPKSQGLKYFYMRNHYTNLYFYQQAGFHWFYLSDPDTHYCTCGLKAAKGTSLELAVGHRELPTFGPVVSAFINYWEFKPKSEKYCYGAICQVCMRVSMKNLNRNQALSWVDSHAKNCLSPLPNFPQQ